MEDLVEGPGHAVDASDIGVGNLREGRGGEVESPVRLAATATIGDADRDALSLVSRGNTLLAD